MTEAPAARVIRDAPITLPALPWTFLAQVHTDLHAEAVGSGPCTSIHRLASDAWHTLASTEGMAEGDVLHLGTFDAHGLEVQAFLARWLKPGEVLIVSTKAA